MPKAKTGKGFLGGKTRIRIGTRDMISVPSVTVTQVVDRNAVVLALMVQAGLSLPDALKAYMALFGATGLFRTVLEREDSVEVEGIGTLTRLSPPKVPRDYGSIVLPKDSRSGVEDLGPHVIREPEMRRRVEPRATIAGAKLPKGGHGGRGTL